MWGYHCFVLWDVTVILWGCHCIVSWGVSPHCVAMVVTALYHKGVTVLYCEGCHCVVMGVLNHGGVTVVSWDVTVV